MSARQMRAAMLVGPSSIDILEVPVPSPGPGEALLRVDAATTCGTDVKVYLRGGHPRMLRTPTLFGHEMAGTIEDIGPGVSNVQPGERVVVANSAPCGQCTACHRGRENLCTDLQYLNGAFAQFILLPARFVTRSVHRIPADLSAERAALSEPLACVLHGMDACREHLEDATPARVLILGGGPIGLLFVAALARAGHAVLLADPNAPRRAVALEMGASQVADIDRETEDANGLHEAFGSDIDVAVDCTGTPTGWSVSLSAVRTGGMVNLFGGCAPGTRVALDTHRIHYSEITVKGVYHHRPATFARALDLLSDPGFPAQHLLSERAPIDDVAQALHAMIDKRALKVVITGTAD